MAEWADPRKRIWGFHVHQELPKEKFSKALVIQKNCMDFLKNCKIPIDATDVMRPGYGPHLDYMWEIRVETASDNVLEKLGLSISYIAINRFSLSAYIHPLMHNVSLPVVAEEGRDNQVNAMWFGYRVPQFQEFFFNPPLEDNNQLVDTRTSRIVPHDERKLILSSGLEEIQEQDFRDLSIIRGFQIALSYTKQEESLAKSIIDNLTLYLTQHNVQFTCSPVDHSRWEVVLKDTQQTGITEKIGIAVGWLMCNRQGLSVMFYPVLEDGVKTDKDHVFFLGHLPQ